MKITYFDKITCNQISAEAIKALEVVANKYGLTIKGNGGKFTDSSYTAKLTFNTVSSSGIPVDFENKAKLYGLKNSDFGRLFTDYKGKIFKLTGTVTGRSKYAFIGQCIQTGKSFKFPGMYVKACLDGRTLPIA